MEGISHRVSVSTVLEGLMEQRPKAEANEESVTTQVTPGPGWGDTREWAVLPDLAGCSQQTLLKPRSHATAKPVVAAAAAAEG